MLKSILNNRKIYENNINRKTIKSPTKFYIIILSILIIFLFLIFKFYNNTYFNSELRKIIDKTNNTLVKYGFDLKKIDITGDKNIQKDVILDAVRSKKYTTIFDINLLTIYNTLLLNEWVDTVQIERILPNSIKIKIIERKPVAIWQSKLGNKLITENGSIISVANTASFQNKLPIIIGEEANKNAFLILQTLNQIPDLYDHIWSISYINKRRWDVYFKQGLKILLPKEKINHAWARIHFLQNEYKILDLGLTEIDIRNENKIFGKINFDKDLYLNRKKL